MNCAIVLAAGSSRRMGTQKLLLPFGGKKVISHIIERLLASSINEVYVVVGHQGEQVKKELSEYSVFIVNNPNYKSDMLSSIRCGLRAIPKKCKSVLVALGDQPSITTALVNQMVQSFAATDKSILVPLYNNKRGHPLLFSIIYRDEILINFDNIGLRGLLHAHDDEVFEMNVSSQAVLWDMDYPQDYLRGLTKFKRTEE